MGVLEDLRREFEAEDGSFLIQLRADDRACDRLRDLAYWLFMGESPYENDAGFEDLQPDETVR